MDVPEQERMFRAAQRKHAEMGIAFFEMIHCKENPMTYGDLRALLKRRPEVYGCLQGFDKPDKPDDCPICEKFQYKDFD